ncbi:MAG: CheR family methyltransferase [bacterium]|nr:CheR family methyltransferase [bacterium]
MITQPPTTLEKQLAMLIENRTGIAVMTKLQHVFNDILQTSAIGDLSAYLRRLSTTSYTDPEWQKIIHILTIGETYFMREKAHFDLMRELILPPLIAKRRESGNLYLNIWSAGCASGEEAYSLTILLHELLPDIDRWNIHLLGTDLNGRSLALARAGVYREWAFRQVDDNFKQTYFDPVPEGWRIKPFLSVRVSFRHANVLEAMPAPQFDLILCRNVLLYFSPASAIKAETIFHEALAPNGALLLGHAETSRQRDLWSVTIQNDTAIYMKSSRLTESPLFIQNQPENKPPTRLLLQSVYEQAVNAIQTEQHTQAETLIRELLGIEPHNAGGHLLMAVVYANQKNSALAHFHLDLALDYDPLMADAHYIRAMLHWEAGQLDSVEESLRAALYSQRNHPLASWMMGDYQQKIGAQGRAMHHWFNAQRAIKPLLPECPVCVVSPMLAGQLRDLLGEKLKSFEV